MFLNSLFYRKIKSLILVQYLCVLIGLMLITLTIVGLSLWDWLSRRLLICTAIKTIKYELVFLS